jgi:hypothetical protein
MTTTKVLQLEKVDLRASLLALLLLLLSHFIVVSFMIAKQ